VNIYKTFTGSEKLYQTIFRISKKIPKIFISLLGILPPPPKNWKNFCYGIVPPLQTYKIPLYKGEYRRRRGDYGEWSGGG